MVYKVEENIKELRKERKNSKHIIFTGSSSIDKRKKIIKKKTQNISNFTSLSDLFLIYFFIKIKKPIKKKKKKKTKLN